MIEPLLFGLMIILQVGMTYELIRIRTVLDEKGKK